MLTDEEVAELQRRADRLFSDDRNDFAAGDNLFLAALGDAEQYDNPNSTCGALAMLGRQFDNRTSLIIDPPSGRIPRRTAAAQDRLAAAAAVQMRPGGPDDLSTWVRCLTRGLPRLGGTSGAGIYGYYQIFQTADHVALVMETIHDARVIPLDGRPHLPDRIRQWLGDSRGRWEGDTLVVETANFSAARHRNGLRPEPPSGGAVYARGRGHDFVRGDDYRPDRLDGAVDRPAAADAGRRRRYTSSPATRGITTACWASWPVRASRIGRMPQRPRVAARSPWRGVIPGGCRARIRQR